MGLWAYGDIFQAIVDYLLGYIKRIKTYIYNILVLGKGILHQHIDQLRVISSRLRDKELKLNDTKCIFGLKGINYLGYIITREGNENNMKKVQGIMNLGQPTTTIEAQELIDMVQ